MDSYKKDIDQLQASPELIEMTLQKIHQEEQNLEKEKEAKRKNKIIKIASGVASMAAVVAITVAVTQNINHFVYTEIPETDVRAELSTTDETSMSVGEYCEYLGFPFASLINDEIPVRTEIGVTFAEDESTVVSDEATLTYDLDGKQVIVKLSKTNQVATEELLEVRSCEIKGNEVHLGMNADQSKLYATGEKDGIYYLIQSNGLSENEFEKLLLNFFENFETFS